MAAPVFKLPASVLAAHKAALEAWDWAARPEMPLSTQFVGGGFAEDDLLEAIGRGSQLVVRCKHPGTMMRMRAWAETLPGQAKPTADVVAAALKARNPETTE